MKKQTHKGFKIGPFEFYDGQYFYEFTFGKWRTLFIRHSTTTHGIPKSKVLFYKENER